MTLASCHILNQSSRTKPAATCTFPATARNYYVMLLGVLGRVPREPDLWVARIYCRIRGRRRLAVVVLGSQSLATRAVELAFILQDPADLLNELTRARPVTNDRHG